MCVKLKDDANLRDAAYNTLGAIAMQGFRQADLRLGETNCCNWFRTFRAINMYDFKASGIQVIGMDVSDFPVKQSIENNIVDAAYLKYHGLEDKINNLTNGNGAGLLYAAALSLDPINFAVLLSEKGKVVLGAVLIEIHIGIKG